MFIRALVSVALACWALSHSAFAAAYIKFDGVDGESVDDDRRGWSDLLSFSQSMQRTGTDPRASRIVAQPFVVTKELDKSSPKLVEAICAGKTIALVTIESTKAFGEARQVFLRYELKNVSIVAHDISGNGSSQVIPTEELSLNFEEIKVTYFMYDAAGRKTGEVSAICKLPSTSP